MYYFTVRLKVAKRLTQASSQSSYLSFRKRILCTSRVYAKPINSWGEFLKVLRELKDPAVKEKFETIVIDTARIAI